MEFVDGVRDDKIRAFGSDPEFIARKGLEAVVRMIFQDGFVHADLHPGNLLFLSGNRIAAFDDGLVGELDNDDRRRFAFFWYYIVTGMGAEVARWVLEQSRTEPLADYPAYEREVVGAVSGFHDQPFENVQLTGLIAELYRIVRRHRIRFEATFTVANIALMVIEGIGRKIHPKLNKPRSRLLSSGDDAPAAASTPRHAATTGSASTICARSSRRRRR